MHMRDSGSGVVMAVVVAMVLAVGTAWAEESGDATGFIYGQVKTRSGGTYEGLIRWNDEEAFWGDHFNSNKDELPYARFVPRGQRRVPVEVFGVRIGLRGTWDGNRQLVVRFGDISELEVLRNERAEITLRNGSRIEADGGSNDLGTAIVVHDKDRGVIELPWRKIESVRFMQAPAGTRPYASRLYGKVDTTSGRFEGYIQWDSEECVSTDKLDGETDDAKLSVEFGRIKAIERQGRNRSRVELANGEVEVMSGTNDVNSEIRGIWVEDPRFGRVQISWDAFRRVDFVKPPTSGPSYDSFPRPRELRGTVRDVDGKSFKGKIVFDVDEAETWEILDGSWDDIDYSIPFGMVASIEPRGRNGSRVTLRGGAELRLEDSHDVGEENSGVLVIAGPESEPRYIPWDEVARIELE